MRMAPQYAGSAVAPAARRPTVQLKPRIGTVDDPLEREADRVADAVMAGRPVGTVSGAVTGTAQRKCAECEGEGERFVQRSRAGGAVEQPVRGDPADLAASAVSQGGEALTCEQRAYFEPRFGRDFSRVRLHTSAETARAAETMGARAFTLGQSIGFASGQLSQGGARSRRLIAHELAHVVQQSAGVIRRQPTPPLPDRIFEDESGGGTTAFRETVETAPTVQADGTVTGSVRRRELAPATKTQPQQTISDETVNVVFDPAKCQVRVPFKMHFVAAATSGTAGICAKPPPATAVPAVSAARLNEIADDAVSTVRDGLNGWYKVRTKGNCKHRCAGRDIDVVVDVTRSAASPDVTINVVNRGGRADSGTICAPDFNPATTTHEGGHQALGVGDEYRERSATVRAANPLWARDERVRDDLSRMGRHRAAGRFAVFHERHFRFASVFVEAALAGSGCGAELVASRGLPIEWRPTAFVGGFDSTRGGGLGIGGGVDWAIPLTRGRRLNLAPGLHALWLDAPSEYRDALLFGARLGLTVQSNPAHFGLSAGVFGGAGVSVIPSPARFGEVGGRIGIFSGMKGGRRFNLEIEGALGREYRNDEPSLHYKRLGLGFVLSL